MTASRRHDGRGAEENSGGGSRLSALPGASQRLELPSAWSPRSAVAPRHVLKRVTHHACRTNLSPKVTPRPWPGPGRRCGSERFMRPRWLGQKSRSLRGGAGGPPCRQRRWGTLPPRPAPPRRARARAPCHPVPSPRSQRALPASSPPSFLLSPHRARSAPPWAVGPRGQGLPCGRPCRSVLVAGRPAGPGRRATSGR